MSHIKTFKALCVKCHVQNLCTCNLGTGEIPVGMKNVVTTLYKTIRNGNINSVCLHMRYKLAIFFTFDDTLVKEKMH